MNRILDFLKHNAIAMAALFIALGGTSYAAVSLPRNSVGTRQLRNGAVNASKLRNGVVTPAKLSSSVAATVADLVEVAPSGQIEASYPAGAKAVTWAEGSGGIIQFPHPFGKNCWPMGTAASPINVTGPPNIGVGLNGDTQVEVGIDNPEPVTLEIDCGR